MKNPFANLFKKKDASAAPAPSAPSGKKEGFFAKLIKNRLGKSSVKGEQIIGVDLTPNEIRLAQISTNKSNQWILDKITFENALESSESIFCDDNNFNK